MMGINGVKKKIIHAGKGSVPEFQKGTRAEFHFQSYPLNEDGKPGPVLDDSRSLSRPMELIFGKQFKMPVWEECLKTMLVGEIATFHVDRSLVSSYPLISHSYRQYAGAETSNHRCCCGMAPVHGLLEGKDVDAIVQEPKDMLFTIELLKVEHPGEYEKESWMMSAEEKLNSVSKLREDGNRLYKEERFKEASSMYTEALSRLEQLILREKPGDEKFLDLQKAKVPLLLNYAQCKLQEKDFYSVIEFTSEVLKLDPGNVKALYKRAKAHASVWDLQSAEEDLKSILEKDRSLKKLVFKELAIIADMQKEKDAEDRKKYLGKMFHTKKS